jgi:glutaredoxin
MRRLALILGLVSALAATEAPSAAATTPERHGPVEIHLFWRLGCPYCERARAFLDRLRRLEPGVEVHDREVSRSETQRLLFIAVSRSLEVERPAVPVVVVGDRAFVGYLDDSTTGAAIRAAVADCRAGGCPDLVRLLEESLRSELEVAPGQEPSAARQVAPDIPEFLTLPLFGEVSTRTLSLPLLTVTLAAVDGFNPCAMWVLVFLIGLLVGMKDHRRMWVLGGAFLVASAAVYFVFMAAWLNLLLLLGALLWIRIAVGLLALGGGAFYLREFVLSAEDVCKVTSPQRRQRIMAGLKRSVHQRQLVLALGGVVVLAVAVNLIELLCSAGIPAVYTQVLTLSALPAWQYYLYLLLYILVFLLDDVFVFAVSITTLQATGLTAKYSRYSHLIGGTVLCGIGALLLLRPEWLTFG